MRRHGGECHDKKPNGEDCDPCQMYKKADDAYDLIEACQIDYNITRSRLETLLAMRKRRKNDQQLEEELVMQIKKLSRAEKDLDDSVRNSKLAYLEALAVDAQDMAHSVNSFIARTENIINQVFPDEDCMEQEAVKEAHKMAKHAHLLTALLQDTVARVQERLELLDGIERVDVTPKKRRRG